MSELEQKLLNDFHGNPIHIDETLKDKLPKLSKKAAIYISSVLSSCEKNWFFRAAIEGGGCSGLQYKFAIEPPQKLSSNDIIIAQDPLTVVDSESIKYMPGAIIDWVEKLEGNYLDIQNPGAKQSCGCGTSFSVDFDKLNGN